MTRATAKRPGPAPVVAERVLRRESDGKRVRLVVRTPVRSAPASPDWACQVALRVAGEPERIVVNAQGVDALQALVMALVGARRLLDASDLVWLSEAGEVGLPFVVPDSDPGFLSIVEALVETEYARRAFTLKQARKVSSRKNSRPAG